MRARRGNMASLKHIYNIESKCRSIKQTWAYQKIQWNPMKSTYPFPFKVWESHDRMPGESFPCLCKQVEVWFVRLETKQIFCMSNNSQEVSFIYLPCPTWWCWCHHQRSHWYVVRQTSWSNHNNGGTGSLLKQNKSITFLKFLHKHTFI